MSDTQLQSLIRAYYADPCDNTAAARLISALLRIHQGEATEDSVGESSQAIAFFIECRTGCSCCANENHFTGPWRSLSRARQEVAYYRETRRLASQYSERGNYTISWQQVEILPDGRILTDDRVFGGFSDDPDYDDYNEQINADDFYGGSTNLEKGTPNPNGYHRALPDWYVDPEPPSEPAPELSA